SFARWLIPNAADSYPLDLSKLLPRARALDGLGLSLRKGSVILSTTMTTILSDIEVRVLGSLVEKQVTTPEYYPLTLNSLTLACNQKNNRSPVTALTESQVEEGLNSLRENNLAYVFHGSTSRVPKFKHLAPEVLHLTP